MATLLTPSLIAREAALQVRNNLVFASAANRVYEETFINSKTGGTISYRKPVRYTAVSGATYGTANTTEVGDTITVDQRFHVPMDFTSLELTMSLEDFSERHVQPAAIALANQIDSAMAQACVHQFFNASHTPTGTGAWADPSTLDDLLDAVATLDLFAAPTSDRDNMHGIFDPRGYAALVGGNKGVFNSNLTTDYFERGIAGELGGVMISKDQNVIKHTVGTYGGTPLVNGASQTGATLATDGWSSGATALKKGDQFTLDGVYSVNPISKVSTGELQVFTITADTSDTSGAIAALPITPSITVTGPQQTVSASPANNAPINMIGASAGQYVQHIVAHRDAMSIVSVPLALPDAPFAAMEVMEGIAIRLVKDYSISDDTNKCRLDILFGVKASYPEYGVRVWGRKL